MGRCVFAIVQAIWTKGFVPLVLCNALVHSLFKKGDDTDTNSYRGISFVEALIKLTTAVFTARLQIAVSPRLCCEQAGFQRREECMAHVVALHEVASRRALHGKATVVAFLDFTRAFDSVPHSALFYKCERIGVRGRALMFIKAMYSAPTVSVVVNGLLGPRIPVKRGSRQGCSMSPALYLIFINDLLLHVRSGVRVPNALVKSRGFMFADDVSLLAPSDKRMSVFLSRAESWAVIHRCCFNIAKCGVMSIERSVKDSSLTPRNLTLQGEAVPIVDEYRFLGFPFNRRLDLSRCVANRVQHATRVVSMVTPFLSKSSASLLLKLDILHAVVVPNLSYGGEMLGMSESLVAPLDSILSKALCMLMKGWGIPAAAPLRCDLDIHSIHATMSSMRARAVAKFPTLRSSIASVLASPFVNRSATWYSGACRWLKKADLEGAQPKVIKNSVDSHLLSRDSSRTKGAEQYVRVCFEETKGFLGAFRKGKWASLRLDNGLAGLVAARAGGLRTGRMAAKAGLIDSFFLDVCPCCFNPLPKGESLAHMFLQCSAWSVQRDLHLAELITLIRSSSFGTAVSDEVACVLLLGGRVVSDTDSLVGFGKAWYMCPLSDSPASVPACLLVVRFLQNIKCLRNAFLWESSTQARSLGPSRGMASLDSALP